MYVQIHEIGSFTGRQVKKEEGGGETGSKNVVKNLGQAAESGLHFFLSLWFSVALCSHMTEHFSSLL